MSNKILTKKELRDGLTRLELDAKEYVTVLKFYADDDSYKSKNGGHIENKNLKSAIGRDCGRKARNILFNTLVFQKEDNGKN